MVHNLIDLVVVGVKGYCDVHGTSSDKCGAAQELGGLVIGALVVGALFGIFKE